MMRMMAIVERELRKFFRSPALMMTAMILPLVQLLILGNAFGGKIRGARLAFVDQDHGFEARRVQEAFDAIGANIRTFSTIPYVNQRQAVEDVRTGKLSGAVIIPPQYSRRVLAGDSPDIGLVVDNSDQFVSSSVEAEMQSVADALNAPTIQSPDRATISRSAWSSSIPYIEYMKFLLSGSVTLAMYVSVMIGGGMLYIDDKARGVHEGYLATPITTLELVMGLNIAGTIKAVMAGLVLTVIGSPAGRPGGDLQPGDRSRSAAGDRGHGDRLQWHDVPHDGARGGSPGAPRHVWRPQHIALFPQRRYLPGLGISRLAPVDRHRRSLYLRSSGLAGPAAQGSRVRRDLGGSCLSLWLWICHAPDRDSALQAHVVEEAGGYNSRITILEEEFDRNAFIEHSRRARPCTDDRAL